MAEGSSSGRGVADGSPAFQREEPPRQEGQKKSSSYQSENRNSSNNNVTGDTSTKRCSCCPYGYHIDLDFLDYCEDISSGANLKKIKKVKRSRPRHEAVKSIKPPPPIVPPRSASVTQHKKWKRQREKLEADKILEKENAAFAATYSQFANLIRHRYMSDDQDYPESPDGRGFPPMDTQSLPAYPLDVSLSDVETESISSCCNIPPSPADRRRSFPVELSAEYEDSNISTDNYLGIPHHLLATNLLRMSAQSGSNSSLSSTTSSTVNYFHSPLSNRSSYQGMSPSPQMGGNFFQSLDGSQTSGRSTPSSISTTALAGVRQQMATALTRLKQLEDQVKAIPVLQVKISVLKEEKRLLMLQLKAKNKKPDSRSIAVGNRFAETAWSDDDSVSCAGIQGDDSGNVCQVQATAVGSLQRINKAKPDLTAKKAIVTPVQRVPVATRSVGVDANFVSRTQLETKSIGINVNSDGGLVPSKTNGWSNESSKDGIIPGENVIRVNNISHLHSSPTNIYSGYEYYDNVQGKVVAQEQYRRAVKAARVNSLPDLSYPQSPPPVAPKPRFRNIGINTEVTELHEKSTMVLPDSSSRHTSTVCVKTVEQGTATEQNVATRSVATDKTPLYERTTNTDQLVMIDESTCIETILDLYRNRACNTDIVQTRISTTNTTPMPTKQPVCDSTCNTEPVHFAVQKPTRESGTNPVFLPACSQSTNTEAVEYVDFGMGTCITVDDRATSTLAESTREQSVGVDMQSMLTTVDRCTATDTVAYNSCTTNTEVVLLLNCSVDCTTEMSDTSTSTDACQHCDRATATESLSRSHRGIECIAETADCFTSTDVQDVTDGTTNTDTHQVSTKGVDCSVESVDKASDVVDLLMVEPEWPPVEEELIAFQSVEQNLMSAPPLMFKTESADKSTSADINVETSNCGTEMVHREVVDGSTMHELITFEFGTITDRLGLDVSTGTIIPELESVACNTLSPVAVADASITADLIEEIPRPQQRSVSTSIDADDGLSQTVGVGKCSVFDQICDRCTNLVVSSIAVGPSDNQAFRTRTIGTNHTVLVRNVGVGSVEETSTSTSQGVGDHRIDEPLCNICDRPITRTVSTEIVAPEMHDRSIEVRAGQVTVAVGDCEVMDDIICNRCNGKQEAVQVGFIPIKAAVERSVRNATLARPCLSEPQHMFKFDVDGETMTTLPASPSSVYLPCRQDAFPSTNERASPLGGSQEMADADRMTQSYEELPGDNWQTQEVSRLASNEHLPRQFTSEPIVTSSVVRSTSSDVVDANMELEAEETDPLALEDDDFMTEGFANLHAILAGASPQAREGVAYMEESILERGDRGETQKEGASLGPRNISTSDDTSDSDSDSSTDDTSDSETTSTSREASSYDRRQRKKNWKLRAAAENNQRYVMSSDVTTACTSLSKLLEMSGDSNAKDMTTCILIISKDWFSTTSQKTADPLQVVGIIASLAEMGKAVLEKVVNISDANGNTALHYSISHGNFEIADRLLESQVCDPDCTNRAGYTAIMLASLATLHGDQQRRTLSKLFHMGNVNIRATQAGQTALMLAVSHGRVAMVELLLDAGADVNIQDEDGSTALMCASEHGHQEIVKVLMAHPHCDPTLMDNDSSTAFSIAMEAGHKNIGVLLYAQLNFAKQAGSPKRRAQSASPRFPPNSFGFINLSRSNMSPVPTPSPSSGMSPCPSPSLTTAMSLGDLSQQPGSVSHRSRSVSPNSRIPTFRQFRPSQLSTSATNVATASPQQQQQQRVKGVQSPSSPRSSALRASLRGAKGTKIPGPGQRGTGMVAGSQRPCSVGNKQPTNPTGKTRVKKTPKTEDKFSTM